MFESTLKPYQEALSQAGVERLGIFGSFARGEQRIESDVDALVHFQPQARSMDNLIRVGDILETAFNRKVDLVTADSLSPYLAPHILREVQYVDFGS